MRTLKGVPSLLAATVPSVLYCGWVNIIFNTLVTPFQPFLLWIEFL